MMKKYIPNLTDSEFHCFLVAAHSTIAGFAFGLFVLFGVCMAMSKSRSFLSLALYIYIYIYIERERERQGGGSERGLAIS